MSYGILGRTTRNLLTYQGRILVHDDRAELEFLFPNEKIVLIAITSQDQSLPIRDHPGMASVRWPLRKEDFR